MSDTIYVYQEQRNGVPDTLMEFHAREELAQQLAVEYPKAIYFFSNLVEPEEPRVIREGRLYSWGPDANALSKEIRSVSSTGGEKGTKIQRFDLIPIGPLTELAEHYGYGARKYADHNWRQGYEWGKSYSALFRHLTQFWAGEDYDVCPADNPPEGGDGCITLNEDGEILSQVGWRNGGRTCLNHTGSHHMVAVAWHAFTLLEYKDVFPDFDDRYIQARVEAERAKQIEELREALTNHGPLTILPDLSKESK